MILLADSGSSKTTWYMADREEFITTKGMNPFQIGKEEMISILEAIPNKGITQIWFYGAGCAFPDKNKIVFDALSKHFGISNIEINSDLLGAARSLCGEQPGIACILGTGSNSCYYDGQKIAENVSPLGYVLGDEGSGSAIGKKLLSDVLKNQLPTTIRELFFEKYNTTVGEILDNVYRKPLPNRYLAQFAIFVSENLDLQEIQTLVSDCFREFFRRNLMQYKYANQLPVHFTGSIAFHFNEILKKTAGEFGLKIRNITKEPMAGLITYHTK